LVDAAGGTTIPAEKDKQRKELPRTKALRARSAALLERRLNIIKNKPFQNADIMEYSASFFAGLLVK
jgi:hypothetical protein